MRLFSAIATAFVVLALATTCQAGVVGYAAADPDGAITNCTGTWEANPDWDVDHNQDAGTMSIVGDQKWGPGHIGTEELDDTACFVYNDDPTVKIRTSIDNDTTFAWTAYQVSIYMNQSFTLTVPTVYPFPDSSESDWTVGPVTPTTLVGGKYVATVTFVGGTPIAVGGTLDFSYKVTFTGTVNYCQEMTPIPEPTSICLVLSGLVGLLFVGRKFAR